MAESGPEPSPRWWNAPVSTLWRRPSHRRVAMKGHPSTHVVEEANECHHQGSTSLDQLLLVAATQRSPLGTADGR
jgi:hypothetical protein